MLEHILNNQNAEKQLTDDVCLCLGDSLELLPTMQSNSVHLIFADPPYNIGKDFGNNQDTWSSPDAYLNWCYDWIDECMRILTDNGTMYLMTSTQNFSFIDVYASKKYHVLSRIIWAYDSSGVQSKKMYGSMYEPILMMTKSKQAKYTFNSDEIKVEAKTGAQRKLMDYRKNPPAPYNSTKVAGNVWDFSRVRYRMPEYEEHPTQKPEKLLERIIKASSNEGDVVFDPFSGSFTTAAVAQRLNRKAIGIEINPDFYRIGLKRVL